MAVNDFTYEPLSDYGVLTGEINYYMVLQYRLKAVGTGTTAIPPLNSVINCYYYPYMNGEVGVTSLSGRSVWKGCTTMQDVYTWQYPLVFINMEQEVTKQDGMIMDFVQTNVTDGTNTKGHVLQPEKILFFPPSEKDKILFKFDSYPQKPSTVGGDFTWKNESKCYQYPYRYIEFNDGLTEPFYVAPQHLKFKSNNEFHVRHQLNSQGIYELYIKGYKGDDNGYYQAKQVNGIAVPINKDSYYNYMNENKSQRNLFYLNALAQITQGNIVGSVSSVLNNEAKENDMKRLPDAITLGSSYDYSIQKSMYLYEIEHMVNEQDMERIGLYFHQYGYAQNKMMLPTFTGRKYWNYLKTQDVHMKVNNCPKNHLNQLKQIFDNGVTVWHVENGNMYENMTKDNVEV